MHWGWRCVFGALPQATPRKSRPSCWTQGHLHPAQLTLELWEAPEVIPSGRRLGSPASQQ